MTLIFRRLRNMKGVGIFADYAAKDAHPDFRRFNLVYGFNGSGKSTLARVFASLQLGTPPSAGDFQIEMDDKTIYGTPDKLMGLEKRVCVFDDGFIQRHFKWAEGKANSIFYISAEQADAARQLEQVERKLPEAKAALQTALKLAKERKTPLMCTSGPPLSRYMLRCIWETENTKPRACSKTTNDSPIQRKVSLLRNSLQHPSKSLSEKRLRPL